MRELTVGSLFRERARISPDSVALADVQRAWTYRELDRRTDALAVGLRARGLERGDRIAVLSENRVEYVELLLAAAKLGAVLACQNWRLAPPELEHCLRLVEPKLVVTSERHAEMLANVAPSGAASWTFGDEFEDAASSSAAPLGIEAQPEDALLILYTSGTTGLPKGAAISHRAELARGAVAGSDYVLRPSDTFVAWPPLYHMAGTDLTITTLLGGGKVVVVDGFDPARLCELIANEPLGWLVLMPGMVQPMIDELRARGVVPRGVAQCGAMADLVPAHQIAEVSRLLDAPYVNTFGSTETGLPPASAGVFAPGVAPTSLSKTQSGQCEIRLVGSDDREVETGQPGELTIRGPTVFSGYWNADDVNARDFRGGWFHLGDVFVRNADGTLDFVDRAKYLIKSGGENVYPAEIERVLLADDRVADAVVVKRKDDRWGEVPVALVVRRDESLSAHDLFARCEAQLARFKQPQAIGFVPPAALPRSTTGKIQRGEIESRLDGFELTPRAGP